MRIQGTLENILIYYSRNRAIGHTHLMHNGMASSTSAYVVVVSHAHAKNCSNGARTLPLFDSEKWRGLRGPLAWDNFTIETLARVCSEEIGTLKDENARIPGLHKEIESAWAKVASLEYDKEKGERDNLSWVYIFSLLKGKVSSYFGR